MFSTLLPCPGTKGPQKGDDVQPDRASLYSISQDNLDNPRVIIKPVSVSNGLVWALNNTVLYYTDSTTQKIVAYDYDTQKGEISKSVLVNQLTIAIRSVWRSFTGFFRRAED